MTNQETKENLKKRIAEFYYNLSVIRKKKTKISKSMSHIFNDSDRIMDKFVNSLSLKGVSIADIGGAKGDFLFKHAAKFNKDSEITLIDISSHHTKIAMKKYNSHYKGKFKFRTVTSDVDNLNIKKKFDIIFFRSILEHLYFPDSSMRNLSKALKDSGLIIIITPNRNRLNERIKRMIPKSMRFNLKLKYGTDVPDVLFLEKETGLIEHIHEYTFEEINVLLEKSNLEIVKTNYSTVPFIIPSLCDKYRSIFYLQRFLISFFNLIGLNRLWGFDFVIMARKKAN